MIRWIKNNFIKIILFFLILFLSFFVFNFLVSTKPMPKAKNQQENYINVNVVRAEIQNVTPFLNAFGSAFDVGSFRIFLGSFWIVFAKF